MKPPISGPTDGPANGASVKTAMAACIWFRANMSLTVPPETDRNALPARPWKKRATIMVWMLRATAEGTSQIRKKAKLAR